jgi:hypothetical protein
VGGKNEGRLEGTVDLLHQQKDFLASPVIEVGRRLIGEDDCRV